MVSIKESAKEYVPIQTKNVAELSQIGVDMELLDGEGVNNEGKSFTYKYILSNNEEYRVPGIVLGQIKDLLESNPSTTSFKVKRTGEGLKTRYTVIPLG